MNKIQELFRQEVANVPKDVGLQVNWSFDIADRIDSVLKKKGMSQKDLAKSMNKTEAEVSRWLGGTHNFTLSTLAKISAVLGCDLISTR